MYIAVGTLIAVYQANTRTHPNARVLANWGYYNRDCCPLSKNGADHRPGVERTTGGGLRVVNWRISPHRQSTTWPSGLSVKQGRNQTSVRPKLRGLSALNWEISDGWPETHLAENLTANPAEGWTGCSLNNCEMGNQFRALSTIGLYWQGHFIARQEVQARGMDYWSWSRGPCS